MRKNLLADIKGEGENKSICAAFLSKSEKLKRLDIGAVESQIIHNYIVIIYNEYLSSLK